jgi:L-lactate dehydrogenase complex protein LldF
MSLRPPEKVDFGTYVKNIPESIPTAVQGATKRFIGSRADRIRELPEWEELRQAASDIRLFTIQNLDYYLRVAADAIEKAGGVVHWAKDAEEACQVVVDIALNHQVKTVVKAKSMASEEISLNHALENAGIETYETDLGEFIMQLAGEGPSHIIVPAVHLKKEEISRLFEEKLHIEAKPDPQILTRIAHQVLRDKFLSADMGVSGCNFLVAESGTIVLVTNEGNGRMCTTLPDLHVAVVGIDKVIPDWDSLTILLKLLARSATGQKISTYTSFITGPSRSGKEQGPQELHVVFLDNGRSDILRDEIGREVLKCIRCGCCLNVCPVYQNVGGYAYGWFISGPIGAILTPQLLGTQAASQLPFASTLCGACVEVCPVKIPITNILLHLRHRVVEGDEISPPVLPGRFQAAVKGARFALDTPWLYRLGSRILLAMMIVKKKEGWLTWLPPPANRWTRIRPFPIFQARFRSKWKTSQQPGQEKK